MIYFLASSLTVEAFPVGFGRPLVGNFLTPGMGTARRRLAIFFTRGYNAHQSLWKYGGAVFLVLHFLIFFTHNKCQNRRQRRNSHQRTPWQALARFSPVGNHLSMGVYRFSNNGSTEQIQFYLQKAIVDERWDATLHVRERLE